jgi:hypothetical protein
MSTELTTATPGQIIESVIIKGDLAKLSPEERTRYYSEVCRSVGLNPMTQPFQYINLSGKLTLYARKDATDQLRQIHGVSLTIVSREQVGDVYVVTARATTASGRSDESIGAVSIGSLKGDALANALMKAETKAKRRVTLSICGLGLLDETELETIPGAQPGPPALPAAPAASLALIDSDQSEALRIIGEELEEYKVTPAKFLEAVNKLAKTSLPDLSAESLNTLTSDQADMLIARLGKRLDEYQKDAVKASKKVPADDYQVDASGYAVDDFDTDGPQF